MMFVTWKYVSKWNVLNFLTNHISIMYRGWTSTESHWNFNQLWLKTCITTVTVTFEDWTFHNSLVVEYSARWKHVLIYAFCEKNPGIYFNVKQLVLQCEFLRFENLLTYLRTVPTIVIAHAFCTSPDTRISYCQCLLIQGYFCTEIYPEKIDLSKYAWYPKRKLRLTMHFWEIIKLQFEKQHLTLLCIL